MARLILDHIHVYARDPDATVAFYEAHFDARMFGEKPNERGLPLQFVSLGGQTLVVGPFPTELSPGDPPDAKNGAYAHGFGVAHLGLNVDDLDDRVRRLTAAGVEILTPPTQSSGLRYAYIAAPDGVVLELTEYQVGRLAPALRIARRVYSAASKVQTAIAAGALKALK